MGGGTTSSSSENRPLTAAERQDLYRSSVGNILNTYSQSGLPNDPGSMNQGTSYPSSAWSSGVKTVGSPTTMFQPAGKAVSSVVSSGGLYDARGNAGGNNNTSGMKSLNPFGVADKPNMAMPTGAADPGGLNFPVYNAPSYVSPGAFNLATYTDPGSAKTLTNGDYEKLQSDVLRGTTAGLDYAKGRDLRDVNDNAAKRGVWSSGLAIQSENDIKSGYAPQYERAGADATAQRYALQSGENQNTNQYQLTSAANKNQFGLTTAQDANQYGLNASNSANQFNQTNAQNKFSSGWAPLNYLSSLWNGTAGNVGGTNTFGANVSI